VLDEDLSRCRKRILLCDGDQPGAAAWNDTESVRSGLLKAELFRKDEDALFHIANAFEIRHINESQKGDYDPAFLDWIFWWYLATIELTDRLLARQADP
jgi:hypothetical protein